MNPSSVIDSAMFEGALTTDLWCPPCWVMATNSPLNCGILLPRYSCPVIHSLSFVKLARKESCSQKLCLNNISWSESTFQNKEVQRYPPAPFDASFPSPLNSPYPAKQCIFNHCRSHFVHNIFLYCLLTTFGYFFKSRIPASYYKYYLVTNSKF